MILNACKTKLFLVFLMALGTSALFAQNLPMPEGISVGKLSNGLTYYIVPKGKPGKVQVRIVSKLGAFSERPEQEGFTHFVEHTLFNGSENFPGNSSLQEIEKMGMRPAYDYNAYTSPRHTEYFMTIPENHKDYLKKTLLILKDWMFNLKIDPEVHEKEKSIIIEEIKRSGTTTSPNLIGTPLEGHTVLSNEEQVKSISVEELYRFYKDNYTPDRLALIVYGKMDPKFVYRQIEKIFGNVNAQSENTNKYIDINNETIISANAPARKGQNDVLAIVCKTEPLVLNNYAAVKQSFVNNLLCKILKRRLQTIEPSLSYSSINMGSIIPGNMILNFRLRSGKEISYKSMLSVFSQLIAQALQHGFSKEEIDYFVTEQLKPYQKNKHEQTIELYDVQNHFLKGNTPLSGKSRYEIITRLVRDITSDDLENTLKKALTYHKTILYDENSKASTDDFNKSYILTQLNEISDRETEAYIFQKPTNRIQKLDQKTFQLELGKYVSLEKKVKLADNLHLLQFAGGIKVIMHHSNRKQTLVKQLGKSGLNLIPEGDRYYYQLLAQSCIEAYGEYQSREVFGIEQSFGIIKRIQIFNNSFEYKITGNADHFEQILKVFHLSLSASKAPDNKEVLASIKRYSKRKIPQSEVKLFKDKKTAQHLAMEPDSSNMETLSQRLLNYHHMLTNVENSVIYISGRLPENAEQLVSKYIGSILPKKNIDVPIVQPDNQFVDANGVETHHFEWTRDLVKADYFFAGVPKSNYQLKDELLLQAIGQYILLKMIETIKDKHGLVYALGMTANLTTSPSNSYSLSLRYMLDEKNLAVSQQIMMDEVLKPIAEGKISKNDVEKTKAMMRSLYVMSFYEDNQIEETWLKWATKYGKVYSPQEIRKLIDQISYREFQSLVKKIVNTQKHFVILQAPQKIINQ